MNALEQLQSFGQGASNGTANAVAIPVDLLAALLRKGGLPIPPDPVGGTQWMRQNGLMVTPKHKLAGELGENASALAQALLFAKVPTK